MDRLAAYLAEFARLLAGGPAVHLEGVEPGSAVLRARVDEVQSDVTRVRVESISIGTAAVDVQKAVKSIDQMLEADGKSGRLRGPDNVVLVDFRGAGRERPVRYGPYRQTGSLDGVVAKIGGFDATVPVWLEDHDRTYRCSTSVELSKELALHYRGEPVRVHGTGRWLRNEAGEWVLDQFTIESFVELDTAPMADVLAKAREIKGSEWSEAADPFVMARHLRKGH